SPENLSAAFRRYLRRRAFLRQASPIIFALSYLLWREADPSGTAEVRERNRFPLPGRSMVGSGGSASMPTRAAYNDAERAARIEMILEELRLNTQDLHELARQAKDRASASRRDARLFIEDARRRRIGKKRRTDAARGLREPAR